MAQKRAAKRSAQPPPPPLPPAASSEETDSHSQSEESEDEAVSPTPAPSKPPAPLQKGEESESSDEEEEEEEEEEPVHQAAPPSAPKNQPPPPQQSKESDASDEDGDSSESDEEDPPKPAQKQEAEDIKPPPAKKARLAFHRIWSMEDEIRILEAVAAHQKQHGALPQPDALMGALAGKLDNRVYSSKDLYSKLQTLKKRYGILSNRGELPSKEHDRRLLDLSKIVWGGTAAAAKVASGHELKGFEEMCELYPYLAEEVKKLEAAHPGMFRRVFGKMDDDKARAMDEKIKKQRIVQIKVELRRTELSKEVTKAILELIT